MSAWLDSTGIIGGKADRMKVNCLILGHGGLQLSKLPPAIRKLLMTQSFRYNLRP